VKLLFWERGGFWLLYKRLKTGTFAAVERGELGPRDLFLLLEGIEVVRERGRYSWDGTGSRRTEYNKKPTAISGFFGLRRFPLEGLEVEAGGIEHEQRGDAGTPSDDESVS
jgi:hypothetical protein